MLVLVLGKLFKLVLFLQGIQLRLVLILSAIPKLIHFGHKYLLLAGFL